MHRTAPCLQLNYFIFVLLIIKNWHQEPCQALQRDVITLDSKRYIFQVLLSSDNSTQHQKMQCANESEDGLSVMYFRSILTSETLKLKEICDNWERKMDGGCENVPSEIQVNLGSLVMSMLTEQCV